MAFVTKLLARLPFSVRRLAGERLEPALGIEALVRAHGDWLTLLATILERENVISGEELARALHDFAIYTASDRPAEGTILSIWAAALQDRSIKLRDEPSLH